MKLFLLILNAFIALSAITGGSLLIASPDGSGIQLSAELLHNSPFTNFLIPGVILAVVVGGVNLVASLANMTRNKYLFEWSLTGGLLICGWVITQFFLVRMFHWLQLLYLITGILVILLSREGKGKWIV